jgi:hypothetical protein
MTHQIIQQPDGLFCVFSSRLDRFSILDATEQELIDYYVEEKIREVRKEMTMLLTQIKSGHSRPSAHFTMTYDDAVAKDHYTQQAEKRQQNEA